MNVFSVIIPFYNREKFLRRTLQSVWEQTYRPIELLLVDNLSADNSLKICQEYAEKYNAPDFTVKILEERRRGAAVARNTGLKHATGRWTYFFDSDDEMSPDFLTRAAEIFTATRCDAVATATRMIFPNGKEKIRNVYYTTRVLDQILTGMLSTQSIALTTDFIRRIGGWDESLTTWDDWELGTRILLARPRLIWMKHTAFHRIYQHAESLTGTNFSGRIESIWQAIQAIQAQCENRHELTAARAALTARKILLAAQVQREHRQDLARQMRHAALAELPTNHSALIYRLLYHYTAAGGKGGWYLFRLYLQIYHRLCPRKMPLE